MMDVAEEIPQRQRLLDPNKKPCLDAESQQHSPTSMAATVSKVLDDDDLLIEILLHVGFPTPLVRAALICKRWYHHASDSKFLSRFRERHPPRLLGVYTTDKNWSEPTIPCFVPMLPQPLELASVVRRVSSYNFGTHDDVSIMDCQNGSVFTRRCDGGVFTHGVVHRPLCPERGMYILPPLPSTHDLGKHIFDAILSEEGGGGLSYLYVLATRTNETKKFTVRVYMLQGSVWHIHASADQLDHPRPRPKVVLVDNKLYMAISVGHEIIVLDLMASSFSTIQLPQGAKYYSFNTSLTRADDASSVYLIHVNDDLQLCIWLHKGDNWLLVDTICLHEMWANMRMLDHTLQDRRILIAYISQVGDNAKFVFLQMCGYKLYLDVTSRTLRAVRETAEKDRHLGVVYPFMMIWPPIFPALKDYPTRNAT